MMLPEPEVFKRGWASWQRWNADSKLVLIMNDNSSAVQSMVGFRNPVPALFTYMILFYMSFASIK